MMPYLRYARVIGSALGAPRLSVLAEYRLPLRVARTDVELTRMNNGRYVTLMDFGRVGLALRCGLLGPMVRKRWTPLVASVSIRFRRSLRVGQAFELVTKVAAFDEKYWYFDQRFEAGGDLYAAAYVKALFRGPKGSVPTREMIAAAKAGDLVSPPLPETMRSWLESDSAR